MKKTDLEKSKALKLNNDMKLASGRFGAAVSGSAKPDRREQRKLDQQQGLVPFACKLDGELVKRINALAASHPGGVSELLKEALEKSLPASPAE